MLRDFSGRSISLSVRQHPVHQLAPEPPPEARSARRSSQYLKPMRYSFSALSDPAPVPPALLDASSARPGRANLPRQRLTAHAPAWPAAARFPCTGPLQHLPHPLSIPARWPALLGPAGPALSGPAPALLPCADPTLLIPTLSTLVTGLCRP